MARMKVAPLLLEAARLYMHNENILEYAIGAISHLAVSDVCNEQLVGAGAVEALLLFLQEYQEDLQVTSKSMVGLRRIVRFSAALASEEDALISPRLQVVRGGRQSGFVGLCMLGEAMEAHIYDETVVREAALLFTSLASNPANVRAIMDIAVKPCMKALEVHQREASVADALAGLLGSLPLEEDEAWAQGANSGVLGAATLGAGRGEALPVRSC